jgi:hypothetical protein
LIVGLQAHVSRVDRMDCPIVRCHLMQQEWRVKRVKHAITREKWLLENEPRGLRTDQGLPLSSNLPTRAKGTLEDKQNPGQEVGGDLVRPATRQYRRTARPNFKSEADHEAANPDPSDKGLGVDSLGASQVRRLILDQL